MTLPNSVVFFGRMWKCAGGLKGPRGRTVPTLIDCRRNKVKDFGDLFLSFATPAGGAGRHLQVAGADFQLKFSFNGVIFPRGVERVPAFLGVPPDIPPGISDTHPISKQFFFLFGATPWSYRMHYPLVFRQFEAPKIYHLEINYKFISNRSSNIKIK